MPIARQLRLLTDVAHAWERSGAGIVEDAAVVVVVFPKDKVGNVVVNNTVVDFTANSSSTNGSSVLRHRAIVEDAIEGSTAVFFR